MSIFSTLTPLGPSLHLSPTPLNPVTQEPLKISGADSVLARTASNGSETHINRNDQIDGTVLDYAFQSYLLTEGFVTYLKKSTYSYSMVHMSTNNILSIIYRGVLNDIIRPHINLNNRFPTFEPPDDLYLIIRENEEGERQVTFSGPQSHYFSIVYNKSGRGYRVQVEDLGLRLLLFVSPALANYENSEYPLVLFSQAVEAVLSSNEALSRSLEIVSKYRYYFNTQQSIVLIIEKF